MFEESYDHNDYHGLSNNQLFALKITSLVAGSISVVSVLVSSYWFVRMRRSFRHEYA